MEPSAGLFENHHAASIESTAALVEDVLIELGHFVNDCRAEVPNTLRAWQVHKGSALVRIAIVEGADHPNLSVVAPVMRTDARVDVLSLYRRLLELNCDAVSGVAFGVRRNEVLLTGERSVLDLDQSEVFDLIRRVQEYADHYDDELVAEFGGKPGGN